MTESGIKDIKILVTFDSIIDLDLAMLKMIQSEYNNPDVINQEVMHLSLHDVKVRLLNRTHENPLSICIDNIDDANKIYSEIIQTQYSKLLSYQTPTGVFKLMEVYDKNKGTDVTVLCRSEEEKNIIRSYDKEINVMITQPGEVDVKSYDIFFIKSPSHIFEYKNEFIEKRIFVLDYRFNLTFGEDGFVFPDIRVARVLVPFNKIGMVNVYSKDEDVKLFKPDKPDVVKNDN